MLAWSTGPFFLPSSSISSLGAAFPLGRASIFSEFQDAFGVFECPPLYWARKIINFDPFKLFMISKHDLLKRLWAFVQSHLIPILVCSVWAQ